MGELLSASSLLLAIAAILLGLWHFEVVKALEIKPGLYWEDNAEARVRVSRILLSKALPVAFMTLVVTLIFLPDALVLACNSIGLYRQFGISAVKMYDAVSTAYSFVTILSGVLAIYMGVLVAKLCILRSRLGRRR